MAEANLIRSLAALGRRHDDFIDDTVEFLSREYGQVIDGLIAETMQDLPVEDGRFESTDEVIRRILPTARRELLEAHGVFEVIADRWISRLDTAAEQIRDSFEQGEAVTLPDDQAERRADWTRSELAVIDELKGLWPQAGEAGSGLAGRFFSLSDTHRRALADIITRAVLGRRRETEFVRELAELTGKQERQAKFLLDDGTMQFSRSVRQRKADALGYEWFLYVGPQDAITRPFCRPLVDTVHTREEIDELDNGQTGAGTVFIAGGGFRCRHHWRPVRPEWFTEEEWAEMGGDAGELEEPPEVELEEPEDPQVVDTPPPEPDPEAPPMPEEPPPASVEPEAEPVIVTPAVTPAFRNVREAEEYVVDNNIAENAKFRRGWNLEGIRQAVDVVQDMNSRFDMGEMFGMGDQRFYNAELAERRGVRVSGAGSQHVVAAWGQETLFVKKKTFGAAGEDMLESMIESNAVVEAMTDVDAMLENIRRWGDEGAAERIEVLREQGWKPKHAISTTTERVIQHELGHRLHNRRVLANARFHAVVENRYRGGWGNVIGRYANTKPEEYAAEAVVAYTQGEWYLLPDDVIDALQEQDKRADETRVLAERRAQEWRDQAEERKRRVEEREAALQRRIAEFEAVAAELAGAADERRRREDAAILAEDPDEVRTRFGAGEGNRMADMMWQAWQLKREEAERRRDEG